MTSRSAPASRARLWVVPSSDGGPSPPRLPAPTLDDSQLLASVRAGDPDAAAALHDRLRPVAERSIRRILGRGDRDHEDLAQQAMIEIVTSIDRFHGGSALDGWASTVAAHVVYNHIRRRTTERRIFGAVRFEDDDMPASTRSLTGETTARSVLRRVLAHLDKVDETKSWAYVLHDVCGYDLRETAEIMGTSVAAAQTRLSRGRRDLMERLRADPELAPMLANASERGLK